MKLVNVVYIHSHDSGRFIEPYGHAIPTPHLSQFAAEGVLFRQAFCAAPTCSPSRAALLTGQWPHQTGMLGLAHRGFALHEPNHHLALFLQSHGYHTVLTGTEHLGARQKEDHNGYAQIYSEGQSHIHAISFLQEHRGGPFFLDVGFGETHRVGDGFSGPDAMPCDGDLDARFVPVPDGLPDTPETRRDFADYINSATRLDAKIGQVLDALDEAGLRENTLVIVTTDHGIAFPNYKCSLRDTGLGVMLMLRGPQFADGRVLDAMVSHVDLFPTICEVANLPQPDWLEGHSLLPLARGEKTAVRDELFGEVTFHAAFEPKRAIRTPRWKYIRRFDDKSTPTLPNCDDSLSKTLLLENGWRETRVAREELFDLVFDPNENCNLLEISTRQSELAPVIEELSGRLDQWMRATNDPLLLPSLPVPSGALVNDADGDSPGDAPMTWTQTSPKTL